MTIPGNTGGPPEGWGAEDWFDFYHERCSICEYDAGMPRPEAEEAAWQSCRVLALVYVSRLSPIAGNPTPEQLIALTAGRISAADELLAQTLQNWRAAA